MNSFGIIVIVALFLLGLAGGSLTKRPLIRLISLGLVVIVIAISSFFVWQAHHWQRSFELIHVGDNRERVRQLMGAPTEDTDGTIGIYNSKRLATDRVQGCTEQYCYYPFFTPECWWIAFDGQGHVITDNHYISP